MNNKNLKPFPKGQSGNPNGRPKKIMNQLKDYGYKKNEIYYSIMNSISCTYDELNEIKKNPEITILEKTVIESLLKGCDSGNMELIDTLLKITKRYESGIWEI
jgi:hypothetical protein